ncbi:DUF2750 domain-containing protein [Geodermatophilus sp. DSM 44513]|uniref:DUF2750 domain-containing protein n=1 Tax=Geodermatophilus sp. DSM 44513 TaxID=1528104 RepID=UPI00127C8133|nr:DUF2750 domain-containing protein [Geodermatophilus sp. DSM 44513]WNV77342.1 DUF2750 domain-containing protein [Geodermatophilus sp. DSM 44513]
MTDVEEALAATGGLWAWGDEDGVAPWTDGEGRDVVPLWTDADQAEAESRDGAEPGERPLFLDVEALLEAIPEWVAAGVGEAGLDSRGGRFPATVPLAELTERLLRLQLDRPV